MKQSCRNARMVILGSVLFSAAALGCAHKITVEIPPRIDLQSYQTIGIVEFSSNSTESLNQAATQEFMSVIQGAQPGVRFLELGPADQVLKAVGRERLDPDAMKALGKKHGVSTIFTGSYDISNVKPKVRLGEDLSSVSASANVRISMVSKQWDAGTGATLWTNSRQGQWPVASVHKDSGSPVSFSMSLPEERYGQFITELVDAVTDDFQPHYERRTVPKS
ncbi:MAG TPA: hypothetical protein VFN94_06540 [Nitrospiria bacterium]|nr:hypothetical protein [Nitrospiria bacterium]